MTELILAVCRTLSMSSRSSVDRAPSRSSRDQGFDSRQGLGFFALSHARVMLISSLFLVLLIHNISPDQP